MTTKRQLQSLSSSFRFPMISLVFFIILLILPLVSSQNVTIAPPYTINDFIPQTGVTINAYDDGSHFLFTVPADQLKSLNNGSYPLLSNVAYYVVGTGPTSIEVWSPFTIDEQGNAKVTAAMLIALNEFVFTNRTKAGKDTLSITLTVGGGWTSNITNICKPSPCPDVIILGTTQFAGQAKMGNIISLENYFNQYAATNNRLLVDTFTKYSFYDYNWNGHWYGVPLTTDIRLTFYNKTTFDQLNLTYPPPGSSAWGDEWWNTWTWEVFVDYARQIRDRANNWGFFFNGEYDEETKLISMIARNSNINLLAYNGTSSNTCAINNPSFDNILDTVIRPLFLPSGDNVNYPTVAYKNFYNADVPGFQAWEKIPLTSLNATAVNSSIWCCEEDEGGQLIGMKIDSPVNSDYTTIWQNAAVYNDTITSSQIGIGYAPGSSTFLGGAGLAITNGSRNPDIAWELIRYFISQELNTPFLTMINLANGLVPPYDSALNTAPWNNPAYDTARQALLNAVPVQYPSTAIPQMTVVEDNHVFRRMFLEMIIKNATNDQAISRACDLLDSILAPECTLQDMTIIQPRFCTAFSQTLDLSYEWITPHTCMGGQQLPEIYSLPCAYIPTTSPTGYAITVLTGLGCLMSIIYMVMFAIYRRSHPIKMASFVFCEFILLGSLFMYATLFFIIGDLSSWRCEVTVWTLVIGFGFTFGGLFVKLLRIYKIFSNKGLHTIRLTDAFLFKRLMIIIVLEIAALLIWTFLEGGPQMHDVNIGIEGNLGQSITQQTCNFGSPAGLAVLGVLNLVLIVLAVGIAFATWSVPTQFNETKAVITSVFGVSFGCFVCVPLLFFVGTATQVMLIGLTVDFVLLVSMAIFCIPKLHEAIWPNLRRWRSRSVSKPWWAFWRPSNNSNEMDSTKSSKLAGPSGQGIDTKQPKSTIANPTKARAISNKHKSTGIQMNDDEKLVLSETFDLQSEQDLGVDSPIQLSSLSPQNFLRFSRIPEVGESREVVQPRFFTTRRSHSFCPHCGLGLGDCPNN